MEYRHLGKADCFCARWLLGHLWQTVDVASAKEILTAAWEAGVISLITLRLMPR